jgi:hypothetical protein
MFEKTKNSNQILDYKKFEKILVDNDSLNQEYFYKDFLKIGIDEIHNVLIILNNELNNSSAFSILDSFEARINLLKDDNIYSEIKPKLLSLVEYISEVKKKIMTYNNDIECKFIIKSKSRITFMVFN